MLRQPRIDLPGYLYHVIGRAIERRKIFIDESDYEDFMSRLEKCLEKTGNRCLAFSLLRNHFHLLILRERRPLAEFMRRLMTGYAVNFNLRHRRAGHLFQNRYKAILCDFDPYFLELVAYIHLNPLRAELVEDLRGLRQYKWCGHGALMGDLGAGFLSPEDILGHFGKGLKKARKKYESFIGERVGRYKKGGLSSGGLRRSQGVTSIGGWVKEREKELWDERVLGDGDFVGSILRLAEEEEKQVGVSLPEVMEIVKAKTGVRLEDIASRSRIRAVLKARALYCYLAKEMGGVSGTELMRKLRLTSAGISYLVAKGREYYRVDNN